MVLIMENSPSFPTELFRRIYHIGAGREVVLIVYCPVPFSDGQDFECRYRVEGLGNNVERYAGGVDELQSFVLALQMAASLLMSSQEYKNGQLYWLSPNDPDLGLPIVA